jgi:hypothetical protein
MLWMGIWVHPYAVLHVQVGVNLRGNGVWPSLYDVAVSWLRLQTPIDCIPHPYWMFEKCFSTLRCCGWAYGYALMPYYMCRWGWILGKMGYVSCLRLQTPKDCIPHPYWMYTKRVSTLRCFGWAYGYTLMPYYMCRWGRIWGKMGYCQACMMLRCHGWGCKPPTTASHIHVGYIKSVWAPWDAVDGHMTGYTLMLYYMCRWGWIWGKMGYGRACMMLRCHGWGCKPPKTASHIHIGCLKSVWAPWDAVDGHMGMHLCRITCAGGGEF